MAPRAIVSCVCIALVSCLGAAVRAQTAEAPPGPPAAAWSLRDTILYALEHSPRLLAESHRLAAAEEGVREAQAGDDPRTSLTGGVLAQAPAVSIHLPDGPTVQVAPATQASLALQVALPIDVNHYWRFRRRGATSAALAQRESYRQASEQLLLETITGYYRVLLAQAALPAAEEAMGLAESALAQSRVRLAAGAVTEAQVAVAESGRADAVERLASARAALSDARASLAATLGLPVEQAPALVEAPLELDTSLPWEQARAVALQERPELSALTHTAESLGASAEAIRASLKPSLSLTASGGYANPQTLVAPMVTARVGLSFSWPLGGNGAARAQARSAEERRQGVLQDLEQTRLLVETQVSVALSRLATLIETIAADRAALREAETLAALARTRRSEGMATALDVAERECAVTGALAALRAGECEVSVARAEWARALGILNQLAVAEAPAPPREEERP